MRKPLDLKGMDKAGKPMDTETERMITKCRDNQTLAQQIDGICYRFMAARKDRYRSDVYAALDRVKSHWMVGQAESRIERRLKKAGIELPKYGE